MSGGISSEGIGAVKVADGNIELNPGRERITLHVKNVGDRPAQVGSHYHFFEANSALEFDREKAFGYHLDISAGTAIRFEPGMEADVTLVPYAGTRRVFGFGDLTKGSLDSPVVKKRAIQEAQLRGYAGA